MNQAPDYCGPVIAWRVWYALESGDDVRLTSVYHPAQWPMRTPLEAVCERLRLPFLERHAAPTRRCRCGIYAALPGTVRDYLGSDCRESATPAVIGRVSLWGSVVECERGWRASHAYPERLYLPIRGKVGATTMRIVHGLEGYGVPVDVLDVSTRDEAVHEIAALERLLPAAEPGSLEAVSVVHAVPEFWR